MQDEKLNSTIDLMIGDCLEVMSTIEDNSIDAIITDPPYGTTQCKWDSVIPFQPMWEQLNRIIKPNGAIVLFASQPFTSALIMSNPKMYRQCLVWEKTRPTNVMNAKKMFMKWHEDIIIFYKKLPSFNPIMHSDGVFTGKKIQRSNTDRSKGTLGNTGEKKDYIHEGNGGLFYPKSIHKYSNVQTPNLHPTQKPVLLMEYLIKTYTNEGETVLDFTMGSGTTMIACNNLNRNGIGIEKDETYFNIAQDRIEKSKRQKLEEFNFNEATT
jgi:site-specific DNA-methyltransferase (adenine-specific)